MSFSPTKRRKPIKKKPSIRHRKVLANLEETGGKIGAAIRMAGYSDATANTPSKITESKSWEALMQEYLSDEALTRTHNELLRSTRIDHLVFPLGPKGEDDINLSGGVTKKIENENADDDGEEQLGDFEPERTTLTDQEIKDMLAEVNCTVRRIVHGETARHVYFWSADNRARKDALEMGYKLKGKFAPDKHVVGVFSLKELTNMSLTELPAAQSTDEQKKTA